MPGLVPGIHDLFRGTKDVDGRDRPGHNGENYSAARLAALVNFFSTRSRFSLER